MLKDSRCSLVVERILPWVKGVLLGWELLLDRLARSPVGGH